jgi:DNA invertase Pin-like site-specific DNA recombinase
MEMDIYARISDDQLADAHGTDNQIADCTAWAAEHGHTIVDVYRDDSVSATSGKVRPGFEAVLGRSVRRPLLVWDVDRIFRVSKDLERVIEQDLVIHGVTHSVLDLATPQGRAIGRSVTAWKTYEGEMKA